MTTKEKAITKLKLGLAIQKIIDSNKIQNEEHGIQSLRKLAASSATEYSIVQKISSGKKDPQFTTIASIIEGFGFTTVEFFTVYDSITDDELNLPKKKTLVKKS